MIVPTHWAEARRQHREGRKQVTVRRYGWSDTSVADAQAMADRRADEALQAILSGRKLLRSEPKVAYNGAEGVPIREEVLARHGEHVITRNAYGARCLNTPTALFADIDVATRGDSVLPMLALAFVLGFAAAIGGPLVLPPPVLAKVPPIAVGIVVAIAVFTTSRLARRAAATADGGAEPKALRRVHRFLAANPTWSVRVYETPAGYRLLVTHRAFDATSAEVKAFFDAIGADRVYARMCANQRCFRARLTAKPWRIGIVEHMRPRPGVWPVADERRPMRDAWIARYEAQASGYAACRYVTTLGPEAIDFDIAPVVELHDRESRALAVDLALA
jgi:hypothetical protein